MADHTFVVTHPKAPAPLTVTGKNLHEALTKEGLDPTMWKEVPQAQPTQDHNGGNP